MPAKVITPEIDLQIRELAAEKKTTNAIAKELKIRYQTVYDHMTRNNIDHVLESRGKHKPTKREKKARQEGFFNEHERQNWLM